MRETSAPELDLTVERAHGAAPGLAGLSASARARALRLIADALDGASDRLLPEAAAESHLSESRLTGELARTTFQLRLFAEVLEDGAFLGVTIDHADSTWPMGPRPDLRRMLLPLGPVAVYAASNFPFAFSVAGGDTAAALAAGCPVVLKAHPGHPRLSDLTAGIVVDSLTDSGVPAGSFAVVHGQDAGVRLISHSLIRAASFTGSLEGGRALFDLACARPDPIPFYGELGSLNPVFVTEAAAAARRDSIVAGFVGSFTLGAGQFCTKPGVLLVPEAAGFEAEVISAVGRVSSAPLLNDRILHGYQRVRSAIAGHPAVRVLVDGPVDAAGAAPTLLTTTAADLLESHHELLTECFGPTAILVTYKDADELLGLVDVLTGQLTATVHGVDDDPQASNLVDRLVDRVGRIVWNEWPTGVSVTWAQHHGGPYPATTNALHTSVGAASISRFLRPVAYQSMPDGLLPDALREANPLGVPRRVDGRIDVPGHLLS